MTEGGSIIIVFTLLFTALYGFIYVVTGFENKRGDPTVAVREALAYLKEQKDIIPTNRTKIEKSITTLIVFLKLTKNMNTIAKECDAALAKWFDVTNGKQ